MAFHTPCTAPRKNGEGRLWLVADNDEAHRHSLDAVLRCGLRRVRLDEPFLFVRTNRNDDFVRRKRRKSVANGETDIRLTSGSIDGLARQLLGRAFGDPLRMTERFLVVGEPVERALPYDRHHDLDSFGVPTCRRKTSSACSTVLMTRTFLPTPENVPPC